MIQNDQKVLILGCGGMLGEAVYKRFKDNAKVYATDIDINEQWLTHLDVRNEKEISEALEKIKPDYIIHLAALTNLEYCELNPENAIATNHKSVEYFGKYVDERKVPFVYVSTAGIFDGTKEFYYENDTPNPLSVYGKTKFEGEKVALSYPKSIVVRAGWMMGGGPSKDKKFIKKLLTQLQEGAQELFVVNDKLGTPCYTYDLANILYALLDQEVYGLYHGICEGSASRLMVAEALLEFLDKKEVVINVVNSQYFEKEYFAPRPYSERLRNTRLKERGFYLARDWRECLQEYVGKFDWGL